jgi:hypothetical protein
MEERIDAHYLLRYALAVPSDRERCFKFNEIQGACMKSHDAKDHRASDQVAGQAKKPWVTPLLEIIALKSAENGRTGPKFDNRGGGQASGIRS